MSVIISVFIGIAILFLAFFAGIEAAFANANRLSIELKKKQGSSSGILLSKLFDEPSRFIGMVLVGFNFFLVVFVLFISTFWNILLNRWEVTSSAIVPIRLLLEIGASMLVVIVFCEFIPKAIFRAKSDSLLSFSARSGLLGLSYDLFYPIANAFVKISSWILNIIFDMRIDKKRNRSPELILNIFTSRPGSITTKTRM